MESFEVPTKLEERRALAAKPANRVEQAKRHEEAAAANRRERKIGPRGSIGRRVLVEFKVNGVGHSYHATKGWRRQVTL